MTLFELLRSTGLPCSYGVFGKRNNKLPYLIYLGNGQEHFIADNKIYAKQDQYQVEYYFIDKDSKSESALEDALINDGWLYEKSEDIYIEGEKVFVIYYDVWRP